MHDLSVRERGRTVGRVALETEERLEDGCGREGLFFLPFCLCALRRVFRGLDESVGSEIGGEDDDAVTERNDVPFAVSQTPWHKRKTKKHSAKRKSAKRQRRPFRV